MLKRSQSLLNALWSTKSWDDFGLHPLLVQSLKSIGLQKPTIVQERALAPVSKGTDTVIAAPTGSGKTLAYLLPLLNEMYNTHDFIKRHRNNPTQNPLSQARPWVIVAPTRDLCAQIAEMVMSLDPYGHISVQTLVPFPDRHIVAASRRSHKETSSTSSPLSPFDSRSLPSEPTSELRPTSVFSPFDPLASSSPSDSLRSRNNGQRVVMWGRRIRWNSADLVVTTLNPFVRELERCALEDSYPSVVVLDEVNFLFQDGMTKLDIFDLIKMIRPRIPIRQPEDVHTPSPFSPKSKFDALKSRTQVVMSGATVPAMGHLSTGAMTVERFPTAAQIRHSHIHRLPTGVISKFLVIAPEDTSSKSIKSDDKKIKKVKLKPLNGADDDEEETLHTFIDEKGITDSRNDLFELKFKALMELMKSTPRERTIIFTNSQLECRKLFHKFTSFGWPIVTFHRGMGMTHRLNALTQFHSSEAVVCIATDLGAQGVDFLDVDHVINFGCPTDANNFLHRAGRVGRIGKEGVVTTFVSAQQESLMRQISQLVQGGDNSGLERMKSSISKVEGNSSAPLHLTFSRKRSLNSKRRSNLMEARSQQRQKGIASHLQSKWLAFKELQARRQQRAAHESQSFEKEEGEELELQDTAAVQRVLKSVPTVKAQEAVARAGVLLTSPSAVREEKSTVNEAQLAAHVVLDADGLSSDEEEEGEEKERERRSVSFDVSHLRKVGTPKHSSSLRSVPDASAKSGLPMNDNDTALHEARKRLLAKYETPSDESVESSSVSSQAKRKGDWEALERSNGKNKMKDVGATRTRQRHDKEANFPPVRTTAQKERSGKYSSQSAALSNFTEFDDQIRL
eukprot:GDKJ01034911.1.p1 GENE.GDKJ01034911.1~~GDKJ01034911.1.p1  ORF type:complete len:849 (-),score=184.05 GDKJ01034911.1:131-2677(-)